jgi:hypothetical protein
MALIEGFTMSSSSIKTQSYAFSLLFSALITLSCFPVLAWHYWQSLAGFGVVAIGGLLLSDCVLWFAAHWSVRAESALVRVVALVCKFTIAAVAIGVASVVIYAMQLDTRTANDAQQATAGKVAEIQARGLAARELASVDRVAAREMVRAGAPVSPVSVSAPSPVPEWSRSVWLVALLPLVSLLGALALSIAAGMAGDSVTENFRQDAPVSVSGRDVPVIDALPMPSASPVRALAAAPARRAAVRTRSGRGGKK